MANFSLEFNLDLKRAQPATAQTASVKFYKNLNFTLQPDCIAGQ
jgi:hypothetical protein